MKYNLTTFLEKLTSMCSNIDLDSISYAYKFAESVHSTIKRKSGEPYFVHCVETALIVAEFLNDTEAIIAGLLHDTVEDTDVDLELIKENFGEKIAFLVDGVTKIIKYEQKGLDSHFKDAYKKLFLAMSQDPRVIIIKFADRLHNMRTLDSIQSEEKRIQKSQETIDIYAPLAHRLGMGKIKWELEDLAFKYLYKEEYENIKKNIKKIQQETRAEREKIIANISSEIMEKLKENGIFAKVEGRPKHLWSIYRKMKNKNYTLKQIYDLLAIRIITKTKEDCYFALGIVHSIYKPINDRFKDYIANPKRNLYQSIHTTVVTSNNKIIEIQIRTEGMHKIAEKGIAVHWGYKEKLKKIKEEELKKFEWMRQLLEVYQESSEPTEFVKALKDDVFREEIFVFTPKGHPIAFLKGATALDFAFAIHTDIGLHCNGAIVNNKIVPLSYKLKDGDIVEILTSPQKTPSRDWLEFVTTLKARNKIKNWFKKEGYKRTVEMGKEILTLHLHKRKLPYPKDEEIISAFQSFGFHTLENGFTAIANGELSAGNVIKKLYAKTYEEKTESRLQKILEFIKKDHKGIRIESINDISYRFAKCCQPIPGDDIIGFISRGRGITVHRKDCINIAKLNGERERLIEVYWNLKGDEIFNATLKLKFKASGNTLSDISHIITDQNSKILKLNMSQDYDIMNASITIQIKNLTHLSKIIAKLKKLKGVFSIIRE